MIKIENVDVYGWEHALRAMRNPMDAWNQIDSTLDNHGKGKTGEKDLKRMKSLKTAGVEQRTYLRMVDIWMTVTAPMYWWKEMDRYTVGKDQISCSTMHKIDARPLSLKDFSVEHLDDRVIGNMIEPGIELLNVYRRKYSMEKKLGREDKSDWWQLIQGLFMSYNQRRDIKISYEVALKIIHERKGHRLDEWRAFREVLIGLPVMDQLLSEKEKEL